MNHEIAFKRGLGKEDGVLSRAVGVSSLFKAMLHGI